MERAVALKKLKKLLGPRLAYRVDPKAPSKDDRVAAQDALEAAREVRDEIKKKREARYQAILAADAEYQQLRKEYKAAHDYHSHLCGITHHFKITVGVSSDMFFHVKAEGDSWEEVIDKLTKKKEAA